jgi:hypothetical protein
MMSKTILATLLAVAATLSAGNAQAYQVFFGEDLNNSATVPLSSVPNSSNAETQFMSHLSGVGTEDFEGQTTDFTAPLILNFGAAGTATLSGSSGIVAAVTPGTTNGVGRYSIPSASSSKYWDVTAGASGTFTITFANSIAALGFYGIDIGDGGGQLTLALSNGDLPNVNHTKGNSDGSVLFYGLIAQGSAEEFTSISFTSTIPGGQTGIDVFGFDKFTIGTQQQVIPEPATLALFGLGLAGLAASRSRKK